jgi:hypothetical protein
VTAHPHNTINGQLLYPVAQLKQDGYELLPPVKIAP